MSIVTTFNAKIKSSPLLLRVIKAIIFGVGGSVGSRVLMVISGVIVSRILGKDFYGQFSMVNSTITLFVTFAGMGIGATLTRYVTLYYNQRDKLGYTIRTLSTFVVVLSIIMSLAMLLLSEQISFWVSESNSLTNYFRITSITVFFTSLASIQQSILLGMEKYSKSASITLIYCGIYLIIASFFSAWKGVYGAVWALLISHALRFMLLFIENEKEYKEKGIMLKFNFNSEIRKIILNFAIPAFAASIFVLPVNWINNTILTRQVGFGELAIFSVALQWMTIITYIPSQLGQVKPIYTDLFAQKKFNELKKMMKNITLSSTALVLPVILIGIIFSKYILRMYGDGYEIGYITFILMMITALFITLQSQVGALLQAIGKMWAGFMLNLIWSIFIIVIFYFLRHLGSVGYSVAYCVSYGFHIFFSYWVIYYIWKKKEEHNEE